ncbi:MAG: hypothetical protein IAA81_02340 [Spirochaetes bacterium]|uniref:Uncharacterized protein n=1 Tax=Candidatus Gallitreponema excrementavium TaxID=2840840 RepID=A0A9D9HNG2_9SPIR|nr:hypothetical protein [Candidatus Gallitreponema excrementavium]
MNTEDKSDKLTKSIGKDVIVDIINGVTENTILKKYEITSVQFSKIKNAMLRQVKEKAEEIEITSHAVRFFRNHVKNRTFAAISKDFGLTEPQEKLLYNVTKGLFRATYGIIFALRRYIPPCQWFYREDERLPENTPFTPKIEKEFPVYSLDSRNKLAQRQTLANIYFDILKDRRTLTSFCRIHNCDKLEAANFIYMKKHKNGDKRYLNRPTLPFITKFREDVPPDWWFIYPEEVSEQYLSEIRGKANSV